MRRLPFPYSPLARKPQGFRAVPYVGKSEEYTFVEDYMKYEIGLIADALFFWTPQKIDLDTGMMYSVKYCSKEGNNILNVKYLPIFSRARIYQEYIKMLCTHLGIEDSLGLLDHPRFELVPMWEQIREGNLFYKKMRDFVTEISQMLERDRERTEQRYDPTFPLFWDYFKEYSIQFAKEWCNKEGIEWYEKK